MPRLEKVVGQERELGTPGYGTLRRGQFGPATGKASKFAFQVALEKFTHRNKILLHGLEAFVRCLQRAFSY